ncbi:uncharacterized protein K02A2.6-like [Liolophura sinensis]|uniref:uncharacterized protein K02A2.6-like n=1 Tax=Liolophura sinensis TaxID=3198878 RepID=UPI0031590EAC
MAEEQANNIQAPNVVHVPTNIPLPTKLDLKGNLATNWKKFRRMWDNYEIATRLCDLESKYRTATLLTCIGVDALDILDGLTFTQEEDKQDIDIVLQKFETFCVGETNETYERYCFNRRDQETSEAVDSYVAVLRTLAKTCNYGQLEDSLIRDRIVVGIRDNNTRKRLLQDARLTLKSCIDVCRAHESASQQMKSMASVDEVQQVRDKHKNKTQHRQKTQKQHKGKQKNHSELECKFCGKRHPFVKEKCPAWGKVCSHCDKPNHFSSKCPSKGKQRQHKVHQVDTDEESSDGEEEYVLSVSSKGKQTDTNGKGFPKRIFARMILNRKTIVFQLDCGGTVNILPENLYAEIYNDRQLKKVEKSTTTLVMFNGTETIPVGKRRISMKNPKNGRKYSVEFVIVKGDYRPLLGARAVQQMNLITVETENIMLLSHQHSDDVKSRKQPGVTMNEIKSSYRDVFQGEGKLEGLLHLEVEDKVQPVKLPCRKVPVALQPKLKEELETLTKKGIIKPVTVPTDWISAMVVVSKPDGRLRLCIDPKPLNSALKRNHYPTPTIDDLLPDLANAKCFSHADAKNGFWHVELDEESSHLTTFETPWGRYRWLRMPFGISTAPEEFQRRLNEALEGLDGVKVVHDDVLVFGVGDTD